MGCRRVHLLTLCLLAQLPLLAQRTTADFDGNGLIEVQTLTELDHIRNDLDGTHYNDGTNPATNTGCPTAGCHGYELMNDLDFRDADADGYNKNWVALDIAPNDGDSDDTNDLEDASIVDDPEDDKNAGWTPIGRDFDNRFTGTLEGNGHHIKNLYINVNQAGDTYAGLFGDVGPGGRMQNVGLTGKHMSVTATSSSSHLSVGALAGNAFSIGTIKNCYATGNVEGINRGGGGVYAGGLIGSAYFSTLTSCYAVGNVEGTGTGAHVGGLVGRSGGSTRIESCYATGNITSTSVRASDAHAYGLMGNDGTVNNSYYSGMVKEGTSATIGAATAIQTPDQYRTETALKTPTEATSIYARWSSNDWDFGTNQQLPILRVFARGWHSGERRGTSVGTKVCGLFRHPDQFYSVGPRGARGQAAPLLHQRHSVEKSANSF